MFIKLKKKTFCGKNVFRMERRKQTSDIISTQFIHTIGQCTNIAIENENYFSYCVWRVGIFEALLSNVLSSEIWLSMLN